MKMVKRVLAVVVAFVIGVSLLSSTVVADQKTLKDTEKTISTLAELKKACKVGGVYELINSNLAVDETVRIGRNVDITINMTNVCNDDGIITFVPGKRETVLFLVEKGASLTINNISLVSVNRNNTILVENYGSFYLNGDNAALSNADVAIKNCGFAGLCKSDIRFNNTGILNYGEFFSTSDMITENTVGLVNHGEADLIDTEIAYNDEEIENHASLKNQ